MPSGGEISFEEVFETMGGRNLPLALNIKADGLSQEIKRLLVKFRHTNYFAFDMSIPDMVHQLRNGMDVFTGLSDILQNPVLLEKSCGVWLDSFESDWFESSIVDDLVQRGKKVCVVSAELHGREVDHQWATLKACKELENPNLMICTDKPELARAYFDEN